MYALYTVNQVLNRFNETTNKNSNENVLLITFFIVAGLGLSLGLLCLYKKISNKNEQLRRQIKRTEKEIRETNTAIDEINEENAETRQSIIQLNKNMLIAQRHLETLQQQSAETERIITGLEESNTSKYS